jgi:hypothetical protein
MGAEMVAAVSLGPLELLGNGGQGKVHAVRDRAGTAYKEYSAEALAQLDDAVLATMVRFPAGLPAADAARLAEHAAWPNAVVESGGRTSGFLMPRVPRPFHVPMRLPSGVKDTLGKVQLLLNDEDYLVRCDLAVDDRFRIDLLRDVAGTLEFFHRLGVVVGDLSPNNLCFSLGRGPRCYFLDCDAMRLHGATALPQVETGDWEAPAGEPRGTAETDRYKFALLCVRLFAGDQSGRDPSELRRAGIPLHALATRGLGADPGRRPSPADWLVALDAARPRPAARAPRPGRTPAPGTPAPRTPAPAPAPGHPPIGRRIAFGLGRAAGRRLRRARPAGFVKLALLALLLVYAVPHLASCGTWLHGAVSAVTSDDDAPNGAEQANGVAQLLSASGRNRQQVVRAITDVIACRRLSAAGAALSEASAARAVSRERADALRVDGLPSGPALKTELISALAHSQAADDAYGRWAESVGRSGCRSAAMHGADRSRGDAESKGATAAKKRVAALWNPVARQYGHPAVSYLTI